MNNCGYLSTCGRLWSVRPCLVSRFGCRIVRQLGAADFMRPCIPTLFDRCEASLLQAVILNWDSVKLEMVVKRKNFKFRRRRTIIIHHSLFIIH